MPDINYREEKDGSLFCLTEDEFMVIITEPYGDGFRHVSVWPWKFQDASMDGKRMSLDCCKEVALTKLAEYRKVAEHFREQGRQMAFLEAELEASFEANPNMESHEEVDASGRVVKLWHEKEIHAEIRAQQREGMRRDDDAASEG